jgi:hypothetical protein
VVGLASFVLFLAAASFRSPQGAAARRAVLDLLRTWLAAWVEIGTPDERRRTPRLERRRRAAAALEDLDAALGGGPSSVVRAQMAAYEEAEVRHAFAEAARLREERQAAYARSASRQRRTRERADRTAAIERGEREAERLRREARHEAATAELSRAASRAEEALTTHRLAAVEAARRREEAERLAAEAEAWAEQERAAAEDATRKREAAERAAAAALARAEMDLRAAGQASQARIEAEEQARTAAEQAERESAVARAAVARRVEAEALAAEAEVAQSEAVHRELAALEAAKAAERERDGAVARMAAAPALAAPSPSRQIDLTAGTIDVRASAGARVLSSRASAPAGLVSARVGGGDEGHVSSSPSAAGTDQEPLARPATGVGARPRGEDWPARTEAVRAIGLLVVPAAVVIKLLLSGPGWSEVGRWGVTALSVAAVLTLLGVRWLWMSTTPPFSLRRRTARRIREWKIAQVRHTNDAERLLTALAAETGGTEAWGQFERSTGLVVPGATRAVVDPNMDAAALVRYLSARQIEGQPTAQPLVVVAAVPLLTCLLPAALLVLVS